MFEHAVFCAQTVQGTAIRNLFELMKDVLVESNIIATPEGMRLLAIDSAQCVVTSVHLQAHSFEHYECKQRTTIGVNMANMYKLVKSASNNDVITLWKNAGEDVLNIRLQNSERSSLTDYKLKLLDIDELPIQAPSCEFEYVVSLSSSEFQRMARDMAMLAASVHIKNDDRTLTLSCYGEYADQETVLEASQNLIINRDTTKAPVVGGPESSEYSLRYLIMFARGSSLSSSVQLYLQRGMPLILSYNAATLGKVLFCLGALEPAAAL
jgi:proliferating cell nuclear antigen